MRLAFETESDSMARAAFGVIVLQTDETIEAEFRTVFGRDGMALYHSRIPNALDVNVETLKAMEREIPRAAALLPAARPLDVVAYGCTSGATLIGAETIAGLIHTTHPAAKTTDPITATIAACRHLGVTRLGFVTPYIKVVSNAMRDFLETNGFTVAAFGSFEQVDDSVVARITPRSIHDAVCEVGAPDDVEAVFAACTNLRGFGIIEEAEARTGKPVVTSNLALAWHMLTLAGQPTAGMGPGMLFNS